MRFIGLDLHKKTLVACALDRRGKALFRESVDCRRESLEAFARAKLRKTDRLAVEATANTWAVADILRPFVAAVTVGNPLQVKAIAQAKVKTDKIDAEVLAHLLRCDYLPTVWTPDAATQKLRQLTTLRGGVIADRTRIKNRVQSLLAQLLVVPPVKVLFSKKGWRGCGRSNCRPRSGRRSTCTCGCMMRSTPSCRRSTTGSWPWRTRTAGLSCS